MNESESKYTFASYVRNFVFGVEDSLVSTVGLLSGIAVAGVNKKQIILTGVILIFVEAFSMGVGSLLSEHSADEYVENKELPLSKNFRNGFVMFTSYFLAGFIPLSPYIFLPNSNAFYASIILSLTALLILGYVSARILKVKRLRTSLEMLLIGGLAILVGVGVGQLLK
jgi:VIT1/CCC1 family predicted Fe2+/Mn2+ transporter